MKNGEKMEFLEEEIKSIAEDLDIGMEVYVNIDTNEIKTIWEDGAVIALLGTVLGYHAFIINNIVSFRRYC